MYIDQHRELFLRSRRLPDVQVERIFGVGVAVVVIQGDAVVMVADNPCEGIVDGGILRLHGHRGKTVGFQHALPGCRILRFPPAQFSDRGRSVRDTGIDLNFSVRSQDAGQLPVRNGDHVRLASGSAFHRRVPLHRPDGQKEVCGEQRRQAQKYENSGAGVFQVSAQYEVLRQQDQRDHPADDAVFVQFQQGQRQQGKNAVEDAESNSVFAHVPILLYSVCPGSAALRAASI